MYKIYKITNTIDGKSYIGQTTKSLEERLRKHSHPGVGKYHLNSAIRKYGINNFTIELIEDNISSLNEAFDKEIYYIKLYNTFNVGYNMTTGGEGRPTQSLSPETKYKISKSLTGRNRSQESINKQRETIKNQPRIISEEHKAILSKARKGIKRDPEIIRKATLTRLSKGPIKNPKLSELNKLKTGSNNPNAKTVFTPYGIFDTTKQAKEKLGISYERLYKNIKEQPELWGYVRRENDISSV